MTEYLKLNWNHLLCLSTAGDLFANMGMELEEQDKENVDCSNLKNNNIVTPSKSSLPPFERQRVVNFPYHPITSVRVLDNDYDDDDDDDEEDGIGPPESSWYSAEEFKRSAQSINQLIQAARRDGRMQMFGSHFQNPTFRGLEDIISETALKDRRQRRTNVMRGVLEEQRRQLRSAAVDAERLRQASELVSKQSRDQAMMRGSLDAMAAYPFGMASTFRCA